ncbi:carboxypeptidase regulatory-like domain-containing protein [Engelhardtia mirabilis]
MSTDDSRAGSIRPALLVVLAILAVLVVAVISNLGSSAAERETAAPEQPGVGPARLSAPSAPSVELEAPVGALVERTVVVGDQSFSGEDDGVAATPDDLPRFSLRGQLIDEFGQGLEGIELRLESVGEPWHLTPPAGFDPDQPLVAETDAEGRFALGTILPTSSWVALTAASPPMRAQLRRDFGRAGGRNEPPLQAGENDLGRIELAECGLLHGLVVGPDGAPVEAARIGVAGPGRGQRVRSGPDGSFVLEHLPGGSHVLSADCEGFLTREFESVEVQPGRTCEQPTIVLEIAPTIAGRVVDASGRPIAAAQVWGVPERGGYSISAEADDQGHFEVSLLVDRRYGLTAGRPDQTPPMWDGRWQEFPPGAREVELVVADKPSFRISVQDAEGQAVEEFGLRVIQVRTTSGGTIHSSVFGTPAAVVPHPGGSAQVQADPEVDDFTVFAPGFVLQRGTFDRADAAGHLVVQLERQSGIRGRFVHEGRPVPHPMVSVRADRIPKVPGAPEDRYDIFEADTRRDLGDVQGSERSLRGSADGTFEVEGLAAGTWELELRGPGAPTTWVELLEISRGDVLDLGDVPSSPGAALGGTIVVATGHSAEGLRVGLGSENYPDDEPFTETDPAGRFEFTGLRPGRYHLWVHAAPGVLDENYRERVDLGPQERRELLVDLTAGATVEARLAVRVDGEPAAGFGVWRLQQIEGESAADELGKTDANGRCVAWVKDGSRLRFDLRNGRGLSVGVSREFEVRGALDEELDFETGALTVHVPAESTLAEGEPAPLAIRSSDTDAPRSFFTWLTPRADDRTLEGDWSINLGPIAPGTYTARLSREPTRLSTTFEVVAGTTTEASLQYE